QKRTCRFSPARNGSPVLEIHDPTLKQLTRTRNGLSQPACASSAAPVHFQMSTLVILAPPAPSGRFGVCVGRAGFGAGWQRKDARPGEKQQGREKDVQPG
ncbi:hypothetical protein PAXRUDRAFT_829308, partial [Paxillus rubicundulus Ve08.2h10]